jgi:glycerol-3-phosphate dehydrogenase
MAGLTEPRPVLDRARDIARVEAGPDAFEVLIIGAGINGAAVFWDLSLQGVSCLLIDRDDVASGASSASTRMAHGGLRYLENGEVRLVAEATVERNRLMRNAPHFIRPLPVAIPAFAQMSGGIAAACRFFGRDRLIGIRGLQIIRLGLIAYDWLGRRDRCMPHHRIEGAKSALRTLPRLHPAVRGVATYYDARITRAERLNLELVEDALLALPASAALTYCALEDVVAGVAVLQDRLGQRRLEVRPKLVINAAGAWIDDVNARLDIEKPLIGGTKGSHLVLESPELHTALAGRAFSFDDGTGRLCIVYPLGRMVLLGSTDIRIGDPDEAFCDAAETAYLLGAIRLIFPTVEVNADQIRFRFAGVRPLPRASNRETGSISRDHSIERAPATAERPFDVLSLVGGKWTTFRAFAEQTTDAVLETQHRARRTGTTDRAIGGGRSWPRDEAAFGHLRTALGQHGCDAERAATLLERYGTRAERIAAFSAAGPDRRLAEAPDFTHREIAFFVHHEMAMTVADIVFRRTTLALEGRLSAALLAELAAIVAEELGQDEAWQRCQLEGLHVLLRARHGVELGPAATAAKTATRAVA